MGDISRLVKGSGHNASEYRNNDLACPACDGKKYTLVATSGVNRMHIVYERRDCNLCAVVDRSPAVEKSNTSTKRSKRKRLSGTGYLRNKKRRRKEDE